MRTQNSAIKLVELAVKRGSMTRACKCELCGKKPMDNKTRSIVAHHWNGYDDPLNIWWICRSCNGLLDIHDGSMNKEQAKKYIKKRQLIKLGYVFEANRVTL